MHAHSKPHIGIGSLLYQDWQRFAISCGIFSDRMLKKSASIVLETRDAYLPENNGEC
jgi:hypothetical protein